TLEIASYLGRHGDLLKEAGQLQLAEKCFRALFDHREHVVASAIKNRGLGVAELYRRETEFVHLLKSGGRNQEADDVVRAGVIFWDKLATQHPDLPELQQVAARNHEAAGNPKRAVELALKAVELAPKDPAFLNTLASLLQRAGDPQQVIQVYEALAAQFPAE